MNNESRDFLFAAYSIVFNRDPGEKEVNLYLPKLIDGQITPSNFLKLCFSSSEYSSRHAVTSIFPTGHFHSPVVDPRTVGDYVAAQKKITSADLAGIKLDLQSMRDLWLRHLSFTQENTFYATRNPRDRYCYGEGPFPEGDAVSLQLMFAEYRPKKVIEIGSGYSSACMLDCSTRLNLSPFTLMCIEPHTERLRSVLRPEDKVQILEQLIQSVDPSIVDELQAGDILFVDSTHVMKTGSDLHYILFSLIPRLKPGVLVHFHDIQYPFEYPDEWVFRHNYSWNEIYVLRAFLMYNTKFSVAYWHSLLTHERFEAMRSEYLLASNNPGGSIWLKCESSSE